MPSTYPLGSSTENGDGSTIVASPVSGFTETMLFETPPSAR